jgi:hypothetical protein
VTQKKFDFIQRHYLGKTYATGRFKITGIYYIQEVAMFFYSSDLADSGKSFVMQKLISQIERYFATRDLLFRNEKTGRHY